MIREVAAIYTEQLVIGVLICDLSPEDHEIRTSQNPASKSHPLWQDN